MEGVDKFEEVKHLDKYQLNKLGELHAREMMEEGFSNPVELAIMARKSIEYLGAFMNHLDRNVKEELFKNGERQTLACLGSELSLGSTGDRLDYEQDATYKNLATQLKARAEILKTAKNSDVDIVDTNGECVMKVGIKTPSRDIIKVKL